LGSPPPARYDFAGVTGEAPPSAAALFLSEVLHQTRIEVGAQGTVAAAATAVDARPLAAAPRRMELARFRADRPFLLAIRERRSGSILFLGRFADPAASLATSAGGP
jgi:serpin B